MTWQQISDWLKEHAGTITSIIVIFGALFTGMRYIISSEVADIRSDVSTLKGDTKTLDEKLTTTNQRIDGLLKDVLDRAFPKSVSSKAEITGSLEQANSVLRLAKAGNVQIESASVQRVGLDVLEFFDSKRPTLSRKDWSYVNNLLSYYSSVNHVDQKFVDAMAKYSWTARADDRSQSCLNFQSGAQKYDFQDITVEHCTLRLNKDLERAATFRKALFRDVSVIYEGGHVSFDTVAFINCTFELPATDSGKKFGETLLAENTIFHLELP